MSEQIRAEFEAWFEENKHKWPVGDDVIVFVRDFMRQAWQASRQAMVVELPKYETDGVFEVVSLVDVEDALDKAGVSYK